MKPMKLKYYMRGLGIGIILTTLILTIANPKEKLTDTEIKDRAKALGMVEETEKEDKTLSELLDDIKPTLKPSVAPTEAPEPTSLPEPTITPIPTPEPTPTPAVEIPENENRDGENVGELVTFTVEQGMSSRKVADMLVEKGLIKDSKDFNQFIVGEGKASVIHIGTYTLPKGASYEEIVTKITAK
jgi:hypothetical protein